MNTGGRVKMKHYNVSYIKYPKCATDYNVAAIGIVNRKWKTGEIKYFSNEIIYISILQVDTKKLTVLWL